MKKNIQPMLKNISILYRIWQIYMDESLIELNIWSWQYIFLMCLYRQDWLSQDDISKWLRIDKWTTAKAIKKLEESWFIYRETDKLDKRIQRVYLSKKWVEIKSTIYDAISKWREIICKNISKDEEELITILLDKLAFNAINFLTNSKFN